MIHPKMLTDIIDNARSIIAMIERFDDDRLIVRRLNEWGDNGLKGTDPTPSTAPTPPLITLPATDGHPASEVPDAPPRSDPTGEAALRPKSPNYEKAVRDAVVALRVAAQVVAEATRTIDPTGEEQKTTFRHEPDHAVGEGDCEACGIHMPGGELEKKRIKHKDGRALCPRDYKQTRRDAERGMPIEDSIRSIQAWKWRGPTDHEASA